MRFLDCRRERFVADDVEAMLEERLRGIKMRMIRCDDGDKVNTSVCLKVSLSFSHLRPRAIDTRRVEKKPLPRRTGICPVAGEHAGDEVDLLVQRRGDAVDAANKGAVTPADHSHSQFASSWHQWNRFHKSVVQRASTINAA